MATHPDRRATTLAWSLVVVSAALVAGGLVVLAQAGRLPRAADEAWVPVTIAVTFPVAGALIVGRRPRVTVGWLLLGPGLAGGLTIAVNSYAEHALVHDPGSLPWGTAAAWLSGWVWAFTAIPAATLLLLLFPDGRLPSRRWRPVPWVVAVAIGSPALAGMFEAGPLANFPATRNPLGVPAVTPVMPVLRGVGFAAFAVAVALCVGSVVVRFRSADDELRTQLRSMVGAVAVFAAALAWAVPFPSPAATLTSCAAVALLPTAVAVSVLRYRLYDVDLVVNRSAVYALSTGTLVAGYAAVVVALTRYTGRTGASVLATAAVAVAFAPVRDGLQRVVDRAFYGLRDDPYRALRGLARLVDASTDAGQALAAIAEAVRSALRVPYVAVRLDDEVAGSVEATSGTQTTVAASLPLVHRGVHVGSLDVAARPGAQLGPADTALLADLAVSAAAAAHSLLVQADLERSRERIVVAREEERRRLRRDLHDGLGPVLTGVVLSLQAARNTARAGGDPDPLIEIAEERARQAIGDVRRVVNDLRPPALDDLGLAGALREEAARLRAAGTDVDVQVDGPDALRTLPAAVEVATYRIAMEALTNVARHARASRASLSIRCDGGVHLEVRDDGDGFTGGHAGVGLASMSERARELGGTCAVSTSPQGTIVQAFLPAPA
jgi:signal transduction histidine kinase